MRWTRAVALCALTLSSCVVTPADWAGLSCNETHECFEGRVCVNGHCVSEAPDAGADGGVDGGADVGVDSGVIDAGGDPGGTDAGVGNQPPDGGAVDGGASCLTWSQARDGFATQRVALGASLVVEPTLNNRLWAHIPSPSDASDYATASIAPARLSTGAEGQLRGRFFAPNSARVDDIAPFVTLFSARGPLIEVAFENNWELSALTAGGVLQGGPVSRPRSTQRFEPGREFTLRVAWRAGSFRRVWVDEVMIFDDTLTTGTGLDPTLVALELGVLRYDGNSGNPLELTFSQWLLCDRAEGELR